MGLDCCLEEEEAGRSLSVGCYLQALRRDQTRHLVRTRHDITQELQRTAYAHITTGANTEYREHTASHQTGTDTGTHIVLAQGTLLKEFLHQYVVMLSGSLYQRLMQLHRLVHLLSRDFQYVGHTAFRFPAIHLHLQHVDNGVE